MPNSQLPPMLPGAHPIHGHAPEFRQSILDFVTRITEASEDIIRFRVYQRQLFFINSPDIIQEVLVEKARHFKKSIGMRLILYPLAGEGLFTANGEHWRKQRKLMAPIFQHSRLSHYTDVMTQMAQREVSDWKEGAQLDISKEMTRVTMGVVGKALFDADTFNDSDELGAALTTALHWSNNQALSLRLVAKITLLAAIERNAPRLPARLQEKSYQLYRRLHNPIWPSAENKELYRALDILERRISQMIEERRQSGLTHKDLLTTLLSARYEDGQPMSAARSDEARIVHNPSEEQSRGANGSQMSDKQVRDEALTLFVAGHETTATALSWVFYLLSQHPEIYRRLIQEVDAFGDKTPTFEDLPRLSYALQIFQEAMRLYPPVPVLSRQADAPVTLGKYQLPAQSIFFFSPYALQRRADLWPDPLRFDPDRFAPGEQERRHRFSYLPFGGGPRICIGNYFAMMEAQLVLAAITRKATLSLAPGFTPIPQPEPTLRSQNGMSMIVHLR